MARARRLRFYFDYISHNAYLAWCDLRPLAARHGLVLEPVPVLFAALLSQYKQVGPAEIPAKQRWMLWNVLRKARERGIAIAPPHSHPFNPLLPLRLSSARLSADERLRLVDALFRATWADAVAVSDPAALRPVLSNVGLDAEALLAAAGSDAVKAQLRRQTERAMADGVFGVPTMRVRDELFWGYDDLSWLERFLDGRDPLPADRSEFRDWLEVTPSAERRRP